MSKNKENYVKALKQQEKYDFLKKNSLDFYKKSKEILERERSSICKNVRTVVLGCENNGGGEGDSNFDECKSKKILRSLTMLRTTADNTNNSLESLNTRNYSLNNDEERYLLVNLNLYQKKSNNKTQNKSKNYKKKIKYY